MTKKLERERKRIEENFRKAQLIQALEVLFMLDFAIIDLSFIMSQYFKMDVLFNISQMEAQLIRTLLTLFNYSLILVFCGVFFKISSDYLVLSYFVSGIFVLLNMAMQYLIGNAYGLLEFGINGIIMLLSVRQFVIENKVIITAIVFWYIFMLLCLEN